MEAFVSYGGLVRRLQAASAENTAGLHMALGLEARALAGPTLCRPCTQPVVWPATAWWFAVPPLVAPGVAAAVSRRQAALAVVPTGAGLGQPCVLVGYTAAPIAFSAGCTDVPTITHARQLKEAARRSDVGVLTTRLVARAFYSGWPSYRLRAAHLRDRWYLYVHP